MKRLVLSGHLAVDLSNVHSATVRKQGNGASSGSVFVPKEWIGEKVVVILMKRED